MTPQQIHELHVECYRSRRVAMPEVVRRAFGDAIRLARLAGVSFPPGAVAVWCYRGAAAEPSVTFFDHRPVDVFLNVGIPFTSETERVKQIVHELGHAFYDARDFLGVLQSEQRAVAFAARAMQPWR